MKKLAFIFVVLSLFLKLTSIESYAEQGDTQLKGQTLSELLTESQDAGDFAPAIDPERLPDELPSVEGLPILAQFTFDCWEFASMKQLDEAIQQYADNSYINYIVFSKEPVNLLDYRDGNAYQISSFDSTPNYLLDIANQSATQSFCGETYTVENMLSLQVKQSDFYQTDIGAIVYYFTDGGVFVRYYDTVHCESREYTLQDFQENAKSYCAFLDHYQKHIRAYEKDFGATVGNRAPDFLSFIQNPEALYAEYDYHTIPWSEKHPWAIAGICCVAVVILAPVALLIVHSIRKKRE